jgi:hypothetical protein
MWRRARTAAIILALVIGAALPIISRGIAAEETERGGLTQEQWAKIVKRMDASGQTRTLPFKVAEGLGLTRGDETLTVRELAIDREGYQHGIYRSLASEDDRIVLAFRTPEKRWTAFATDTRFKLIAAIVWNAGEPPVPWAYDEALPAFRNEVGYWAILSDIM